MKISLLENSSVRRKVRYMYFFSLLLFSMGILISDVNVKEDKEYSDMDHITMYIYEYDELPSNYVAKSSSYLSGICCCYYCYKEIRGYYF